MSLSIKIFPDPLLRKVCAPVIEVDSETSGFIRQLDQFMKAQPGGIGIAAPQVGILKQIAIVDVGAKVPGAEKLILINPIIIERSSEIIQREGCMSLPHFTANVGRFSKIKIKWENISLMSQTATFEGLEAICIQHEVDHLNGMLIVDRVACLNTDVFRRKRYL